MEDFEVKTTIDDALIVNAVVTDGVLSLDWQEAEGVYKYWIENISSKDSIFARFTVRQLGSMSYSRIKELPIDDQKKIFVVMGEMLSSLPETKGLGYYEKLLYRAIKQKDFDKWRFLCKYCFV